MRALGSVNMNICPGCLRTHLPETPTVTKWPQCFAPGNLFFADNWSQSLPHVETSPFTENSREPGSIVNFPSCALAVVLAQVAHRVIVLMFCVQAATCGCVDSNGATVFTVMMDWNRQHMLSFSIVPFQCTFAARVNRS
ncbi:unnamed protein product [Polarella glacialis]|uniref:Uncharacterized protein n=1 Tax=Polarella glacialis TaxID=89957 RepID=A0A813G9A0_POLGL|nr:unnamed protein product [Polarella glacialis]